MIPENTNLSMQTLPVYRAGHFVVTNGVAEGDEISFADELILDDIYQLKDNTERSHITVTISTESDDTILAVAPGSGVGVVNNRIYLDSCLTLIAPDSTTFEVLILVEVEDGDVVDIYMLPLAEMFSDTDYRLVGVDRNTAVKKFGEMACVSFARGTHITMATGKQVRIEELNIGDKVLTRDDGPQKIRWIGCATLRAVGDFAPVVITKGTLHNTNDLVVSPEHRIFVYQRQDKLGAGRSEVLVRVRHLINGETVYQQNGGFIDYFQLLFDEHQIIYAEGIAAESLLIDPRTRRAVPDTVRKQVDFDGKGHARRNHLNYEVQEQLVSDPAAASILKNASSS